MHWEVAAILAAVLFGGGQIISYAVGGPRVLQRPNESSAAAAIIDALEVHLGFRAEDADADARVYVPEGFLVITEVVSGGAIADAGIRPHDLVRYPYADCFYKSLALGQGRTVEVPIQRGRKRLLAQVYVPTLDLPADPTAVRWVCPDSIVPGGRP